MNKFEGRPQSEPQAPRNSLKKKIMLAGGIMAGALGFFGNKVEGGTGEDHQDKQADHEKHSPESTSEGRISSESIAAEKNSSEIEVAKLKKAIHDTFAGDEGVAPDTSEGEAAFDIAAVDISAGDIVEAWSDRGDSVLGIYVPEDKLPEAWGKFEALAKQIKVEPVDGVINANIETDSGSFNAQFAVEVSYDRNGLAKNEIVTYDEDGMRSAVPVQEGADIESALREYAAGVIGGRLLEIAREPYKAEASE